MKEERRKEKLIWVGDHANEVLKNTDKNVLSFYDNEVLLFERNKNELEPENNTTYLDEFYPMIDRKYTIEDLNKPVSTYLKHIKANSEEGLMVGDGCEILFQAVVNSSFNSKLSLAIEELQQELQQVEKIEEKDNFQLTDLSNKNVLFLKDGFPFADMIEESNTVKKNAKKGFKNTLFVNTELNNLNEFLWNYHEGLDLAVMKSKDISL